ncbi:hypothetical protein ACIGEZ_11975 [Streptomyces sp. NPDC085481]|uniref:hypothetical protein n=1 Tax=Streptomyces sp. NPDC085481 TaxID=3365727 RepID=UPI0037CE473E
MISEPELVGGTAFPDALPPLPVDQDQDQDPDPRPRPPRAGRPWLWALGGAVVASAVWAGGLYAYDRQGEDRGPDLGGYRADVDPCKEARLAGLSSSLGRKGETTDPLTQEHPALFRAECVVSLEAKPAAYEVAVTYTLHRVTDPGPEFEAAMNDPLLGVGDRISGVGELAYVREDNGSDMELHVLDGQAVIVFSLSLVPIYDAIGPGAEPSEPPELDPAATRTFLVEDMTALMAALKK